MEMQTVDAPPSFNEENKNEGTFPEVIVVKEKENRDSQSSSEDKPKRKSKLMKLIFYVLVVILCYEIFLIGYEIGKAHRTPAVGKSRNAKKLLLVSIDGFRFEYLTRGKTPNLAKLAKHGYTSRLVPQFPSYTFPNHYSLVTGLFPESHGIVSNSFFDPKMQEYFYFTNSTSFLPSFWNADPIWSTNQDQGGKSAIMFWPGSDVKINGKRPTRAKEYVEELSGQERVDHLLSWIDEEPDFNLMAVYFSEVDHAGHYFGPYSSQLEKSLLETDAAIGNLLSGLERRDMLKDLNVVIVSDHGMTQGSDKRKLFIENYVPKLKELIEWADFGPVVSIIPKRGHEKRLTWKIWKAIQRHKLPVKMYTKQNMPSAYHYTENERIPPIILEARRGWTIDTNDSEWHPKGLHGYGDSCRDMDGIFIGAGPQFRPSEPPKYGYYSNLDVYPLLCNLLDIYPKPNNGTLALLNKAIKNGGGRD